MAEAALLAGSAVSARHHQAHYASAPELSDLRDHALPKAKPLALSPRSKRARASAAPQPRPASYGGRAPHTAQRRCFSTLLRRLAGSTPARSWRATAAPADAAEAASEDGPAPHATKGSDESLDAKRWFTTEPWHESVGGAVWRLLTEGFTQAVLPACVIYCTCFVYTSLVLHQTATWHHAWQSIVAFAYALLEVAFLGVHALQKRALERRPPPPHATPDEGTFAEKLKLLREVAFNLQHSIEPVELSSRKSLSRGAKAEQRAKEICKWFVSGQLGKSGKHPTWQEIGYEKMLSWLAWAFWNGDVGEAAPREEVEALYRELTVWVAFGYPEDYNPAEESNLDFAAVPPMWRLDPIGNPGVQPLRLTLDPIDSAHRPLLSYVVTQCIMGLLLPAVLLSARGFSKHSCERTGLSYWIRQGRPQEGQAGQQSAPMVFLHGLGVGVLPYIAVVDELVGRHPDTDPARTVVLVELPHISLTISPPAHVPSPQETVSALVQVLAKHGVTGGVHLVGHSYGSCVMAWVMKSAPRSWVRGCTFMDPVCFLLYNASVAYNFVYRPPTSPLDCAIKYFVGQELHTSYILHRHFFWARNTLCPSAVDAVPFGVVLSEHDSLVPSAAVARHLSRHARPNLIVRMLEGHSHAEFITNKVSCRRAGDVFREVERHFHTDTGNKQDE